MVLTPKGLQEKLLAKGYDLGPSRADGVWGAKTRAAVEGWFSLGTDLDAPDVTQPGNMVSIIDPAWLPDCDMDRIVLHWSVGTYTASAVDKEHYHFIVEGSGRVVRGDNSVKANVSTSDADGYAAHCNRLNTKSIGIAVAAMAGAVERPFNAGPYPMTEKQWLTMAAAAADCCRKYKIPVTPKTVLQHGEVEKTLGVDQNGKWDVLVLPWAPTIPRDRVCEMFREEVRKRL